MSCSILNNTVETVPSCPITEQERKKASERKNCSAFGSKCSDPKIVYHCVINPFLNGTVELCAYNRIIFYGHCTEYSFTANRIHQSIDTYCNNVTKDPCPNAYNSSEAYKYPACYDLVKGMARKKVIPMISTPLLTTTTNAEFLSISTVKDGINRTTSLGNEFYYYLHLALTFVLHVAIAVLS